MPRSFLVKKYFSNKKPNYSELECQSVVALRYPLAELPTQDNGSALTCYSAGPLFGAGDLPAPLSPVALVSPTTTPSPSPSLGPLDLSSSPSGSSSGEDEDEDCGGRTSDPPSPDSALLLRRHHRAVHHCPRCTKSYGSASALCRHLSSHRAAAEGEQQRPQQALLSSSSPGQASPHAAFNCKHCPKEYTSLGALKMHIRSHTLPCVCPTCGKAFSRPWLLRGHIRTHTGERPFSCQHCNRAFADRSNLRAHLQTHSEVKKYQCGSCARTFSRMSLLHKHTASGCCPAP